MSIWLWIATGIITVIILSLSFLVSLFRQTQPLSHPVGSFVALQRPLSIWTPMLPERGDIFVGTSAVPSLIQFRKKLFKSKSDQLIFRMRNSDAPRAFFEKTVEGFRSEGIEFTLELTKKLRKPRAAVVSLPTDNVLFPSAAANLCRVVFEANELEERDVIVSCHGRTPEDAGVGNWEGFPPTRAAAGELSLAGLVLLPLRLWHSQRAERDGKDR